MAYVMGQAVLSTAATVQQMFRTPAGLCNVTFWNITPSATVYIGTSTMVTSVNGLVCHSIPTSFFQYVSSGGVQFYGTVASGPGTVSYILVTDQ